MDSIAQSQGSPLALNLHVTIVNGLTSDGYQFPPPSWEPGMTWREHICHVLHHHRHLMVGPGEAEYWERARVEAEEKLARKQSNAEKPKRKKSRARTDTL